MNKSYNLTPSKSVFLFLLFAFFSTISFAGGLIISPVKPAEPFIEAAFPDATTIGVKSEVVKEGDLPMWTIKKDDDVIGYAFETDDIALIPAYSGEPVNSLVSMDTAGKIISVHVLEHHEPILLIGIPEQKLHDFTDQYAGFMSTDLVKIGGQKAGEAFTSMAYPAQP